MARLGEGLAGWAAIYLKNASFRNDARVHQPGYSGGRREALQGGVVVAEVGDIANTRRKFDPLDNILRNIYSSNYQGIDMELDKALYFKNSDE
jgi:hypothetical protein